MDASTQLSPVAWARVRERRPLDGSCTVTPVLLVLKAQDHRPIRTRTGGDIRGRGGGKAESSSLQMVGSGSRGRQELGSLKFKVQAANPPPQILGFLPVLLYGSRGTLVHTSRVHCTVAGTHGDHRPRSLRPDCMPYRGFLLLRTGASQHSSRATPTGRYVIQARRRAFLLDRQFESALPRAGQSRSCPRPPRCDLLLSRVPQGPPQVPMSHGRTRGLGVAWGS